MTTALTDTATLTGRALRHWRRQPTPVLVTLLFPILLVLMFGYLLGGAMVVPGGGDYREFLLPGLFAMTMLFGVETTYTAVTTDAARGVTDRLRSLPVARGAVIAGRATADALHAVAALAVMLACGLAVGWQPHDGAGRALAAVGLLLLLRLAMIVVGIHLALLLRAPDSVVALQILVWPVGFASSAFVAPQTMPGWLASVAAYNPLSVTVAACRELFGNPGWGGDGFTARHAVALAVAWPLAVIAVAGPLAVRRWQRLDR
ncbi:ABC transporter permease [Micromonospora siamensis]|uniref:Transport permease protein n=1 Tax=Micromonospora siamensis TaxID=299152 RepID=A0A1C5IJQ0_9ACTN|nr:ABC transporter permease [Micromonospora siamensis]SCG58241.1 ABC transporter efflux protein, DrrB family [Micromonospora siamensis]